jgi:intermediate peptidase
MIMLEKTLRFNKTLQKNLITKLTAHHSISTLSPLGSLFNQKPKSNRLSLNLKKSNVGLFGLKDLKTPDGFHYLKDEAESSVNTLLKEVLSNETTPKRKLVQTFDDISNELCKVADLSEFVRTSHPNQLYREAADYTFACISEIVEKLNTNLELYKKLRTFYETADENKHFEIDECDKRVTKLYLADFEQSGIHLDEDNRRNFVQVNNKLIEILMKFQINSQLPSEIVSKNVDKKFEDMYVFWRLV